jgi:AcrR family transcriptional regulator
VTERRRQQDRTRTTRAALIAAGRGLFAERGYAAVTAEEIVATAGLTRGALRHHFGDKRELFHAVFEELETEIAQRSAAAVGAAGDDTWAAIESGITAFLDSCQEPEVVQIALTDAPAVLGWPTWRAIEARHGLGLIQAALGQAIHTGLLKPQPVDILAHLLLSAMIETALLIARDPERRPALEQALLTLIRGLRST